MSSAWSYRYGRILLLGDSITQISSVEAETPGWSAIIAHAYQRKADIVRRGFSGYNTEWIRIALPELLAHNRPAVAPESAPEYDAAVVFLGANDACVHPPQHTSVERYGENLTAIVNELHTTSRIPFDRIIVLTPPAVDNDMYENYVRAKFNAPRSRHNEVTKKYADAALTVASTLGTRSLNLWKAMNDYDSPTTPMGTLLLDGLHLSAKGGIFLAKHLLPILDATLTHLHPVLPEWRAIAHDSPEASLSTTGS